MMLEDLPDELDRGPLDPVRIFEALERHGVEYLTIGGVAVNAHGHLRNTRDVDVLIEWTAENIQRLAAAFKVAADLQHNSTLSTLGGDLNLFDPKRIPGGRPYDEMCKRALEVVVEGVRVRAVGLDDLIRLKRESGRDRDLEDVATLLTAARNAVGENEPEP